MISRCEERAVESQGGWSSWKKNFRTEPRWMCVCVLKATMGLK